MALIMRASSPADMLWSAELSGAAPFAGTAPGEAVAVGFAAEAGALGDAAVDGPVAGLGVEGVVAPGLAFAVDAATAARRELRVGAATDTVVPRPSPGRLPAS